MKRQTTMIKTSDNFFPNFPNNEVQVSFNRLNDGLYRVAVWGMDDFGMDKDFVDKDNAEELFKKLSKLKNVTKQILKENGLEVF